MKWFDNKFVIFKLSKKVDKQLLKEWNGGRLNIYVYMTISVRPGKEDKRTNTEGPVP